MALKVYFDLMSQPCRALILFLKANSIPFEACTVALRKGEHLSEDFAKINPLQKVPVINHDGFILTESVAMLRYLAKEFHTPDNWYPKDSKMQARVDEYLEWQHLNTRLFGAMIFRTRVIDPALKGEPADEKKLNFYKNGFGPVLDNIEKGFLKNRNFLCGDQISIADLLGVCEVEQPLCLFPDIIGERPNIKAWMERVKGKLQPHYDETHAIVGKLKEAVLKGKL